METYDAAKRRAYYLRVRQLKGRQAESGSRAKPGFTKTALTKPDPRHGVSLAATKTLARLTIKVSKIDKALKETTVQLAAARKGDQKERETAKKTKHDNSDGKSTQKEKTSAKEYRDKNKTKLAAKRSSGDKSSPGKSDGSSKADQAKKVKGLETRVSELQVAKRDALSLIKVARSQIE